MHWVVQTFAMYYDVHITAGVRDRVQNGQRHGKRRQRDAANQGKGLRRAVSRWATPDYVIGDGVQRTSAELGRVCVGTTYSVNSGIILPEFTGIDHVTPPHYR